MTLAIGGTLSTNTTYMVAGEYSRERTLLTTTVLPAKSDSDVMFCLHNYQGLITDISLVCKSYPQDRINTQVIY